MHPQTAGVGGGEGLRRARADAQSVGVGGARVDGGSGRTDDQLRVSGVGLGVIDADRDLNLGARCFDVQAVEGRRRALVVVFGADPCGWTDIVGDADFVDNAIPIPPIIIGVLSSDKGKTPTISDCISASGCLLHPIHIEVIGPAGYYSDYMMPACIRVGAITVHNHYGRPITYEKAIVIGVTPRQRKATIGW